ncbi:phosphoethanolamine transferase [Rheinheimera marina]|uniref:Phosphoethanolamine transferase n=1 Tax=Rheinheimera marina TaxID=1774958 RepID=A0ABV9JMT6_9GAMM
MIHPLVLLCCRGLVVLLLLLALMAPVLVQWPAVWQWDYLYWKLLPAAAFYLFLCSLFSKIRWGLILLLPFLLLVPQEVFYLYTYQKSTDAHALAIVAETDLAEAAGYLTGIGLLLAALVVGLIALWGYTLRFAWLQKWQWGPGWRPCLWLVFAGLAASTSWHEWQYQQLNKAAERKNPQETVFASRPLPYSYEKFHATYPLNLLVALNEFRVQREATAQVASQMEHFRFGAKQQPELFGRQIYVLVVGETLRPDRLQLNGYARSTTPRLAGTDNLISYPDMISPWAWTRMSVPVILSRKAGTDQRYFPAEASLVTAFKEAGFSTYWLSTQSPLGVHDSSIALHASEADQVQYLNPVGYRQEGFYDEILLPAVERVLAQDEQKQLIVLHTLGSHFSYADRYPKQFDLFTPSGKGQSISMHDSSARQLLNNAYDNSVAYTDFVLFNLINQLKQTEASSALLFVSDHGENIFDGQCGKSGHGHNTEFDYRVAALLWFSEALKAQQPQKTQLAQSRRQQPLMTTQVFDTLLDLANLSYPEQQLQQSWVNPLWQPGPRVLQQGINFDTAKRDPVCKELSAVF